MKKENTKKILAGTALYASIVIGSVLHGADKAPKGVLFGFVFVTASLFSFLLGAEWWSLLIGALASCLYWFLYRSGIIADAELSFMYMADRIKLSTVWKAYLLPVAVSVAAILGAFIYCKMYWLCALPILSLPTIYVPAWASKKYADYKQVGFTPESERKARSRVELFQAIAPSGVYCLQFVYALSALVQTMHN